MTVARLIYLLLVKDDARYVEKKKPSKTWKAKSFKRLRRLSTHYNPKL